MATSFEDILTAMPEERRERILARGQALLHDSAALQLALDAEVKAERMAYDQSMSFSVYRDADGQYRFRLSSADGVALIESPPYPDEASALEALAGFRRRLVAAEAPGDVKLTA